MADTGSTFKVRLVTPERVLIDETADAVEIPSKSGYFEVLYGHAPLLAELGVGLVKFHGGSVGEKNLFLVWGFCEVLPDRVTILAASVVKPEEIDVPAAQSQLERGRQMWTEAGASPEKYAQANQVIHEAEVKLATAKTGHS